MQRRRVVITGIGIVSPLGNCKEALWDGLVAGRSAVGPVTSLPVAGLPIRFAAEAREFTTDDIDGFGPLEKDRKKAIRKALKVMCRECQMGLAVGQLALADAQFAPGSIDPDRIGIDYNSDYMITMPEDFVDGVRQCLGADGHFEFARWAAEGLPKMTPLWLLRYLPNMPAGHLAIFNDLRGPNNSITLREAGANAAINEAYHIIVRGSADAMVTGATGSRMTPLRYVHAIQQEELADGNGDPTRACRPFDLHRRGAVLGEGAAALVLEELESAKGRGATIYGEVLGGAVASAAGSRLQLHRGRAMTNALRQTLELTGLKPDAVGHLHAHGLGTRSCDVEESQAIEAVFSQRATPLPVVAAKSNFGNLGGASGMVELIASLLATRHGQLFPVLNYETPDPECPINVVRSADVPAGDCFVNLNVTPQGQASAIAIGRAG
jgi:3-oxoacyl-[acyl-carrier-protein] synthase II